MIKVNLLTNSATREALPSDLIGISEDDLINLQDRLKPVPTNFLNIVYWPEIDQTVEIDDLREKYGAEIFTLDIPNKQVIVTRQILTLSPPDKLVILAEKRANLKHRVNIIRDQTESGGLTVTGIKYSTTVRDIGRITALRQIAIADAGATFNLELVDNETLHTVNSTELIAVSDALALFIKNCSDNAKAHHIAIDAITTRLALRDYDPTTGWPT